MNFRIITKPGCAYCDQAKALLKGRNHAYVEDRRETPESIQAFVAEGYRTFPQIFHGETHVGGFDQLRVYLAGLSDDDF